jgi:hypothetical protein
VQDMPLALARDDAAGWLFDSLSDEDVFFSPSDNGLLKDVLRKSRRESSLTNACIFDDIWGTI